MNILIVNTSDVTGGAAIAANRLMEALKEGNVHVRMLVRDKRSQNLSVLSLKPSPLLKLKFVWERAVIWLRNRLSTKNLWQVDIANAGTDITRLPEFQWADVIHLHWVNQGFLSWSDVEHIVKSGKRVVWTLHDQWPYTGICHYTDGCERYQTHCHHCPLLKGGNTDPEADVRGGKDLSYRLFEKKMATYRLINHITFVGCSQWIADLARKSALLQPPQPPRGSEMAREQNARDYSSTPLKVVHIPNTINQRVFRPSDKMAARTAHGLPQDKKLLLFSSLKVTDKRKGIDYLIEACRMMHEQHPEWDSQLGIVVVGKQAEAMQGVFPYPLYAIDYISDEKRMALLYTAVDAFVTPSLQDNLPNTIVEAMSVGTPCVGFRVGGIPEMINHRQDGYVAEPCNAEDLAEGILYVIDKENHESLSQAAAKFAARTYNPTRIARMYEDVYRDNFLDFGF